MIIGIGNCIGENLLLGIGIVLIAIFQYRWNNMDKNYKVVVVCLMVCGKETQIISIFTDKQVNIKIKDR